MYTTPTSFIDQRRRRRARVVSLGFADKSSGWGADDVSGAVTGLAQGASSIMQSLQKGDTSSAIMAGVSTVGGGIMSIIPASAIPVVGPIIVGVTMALQMLLSRKGPKQKVATTEIVNAVEPELKRNMEAYLALPVRYKAAQALALANFDAGWAWVASHCNIPEMGNPGIECTKDRQRGGQWDWFSYYRDPIADDPGVVANPPMSPLDIPGTGSINIGGISVSPIMLGGAALLVLLMVSGGGGGKR